MLSGALEASSANNVRSLESMRTFFTGSKVRTATELAYWGALVLLIRVWKAASPTDDVARCWTDIGAMPESSAGVAYVHLLSI